MATVIKTTFKLRRATAQEWTLKNPVLAAGEPGFEIDTNKLKIGNGTTPWTALAYLAGSGSSGESNESLIFEIIANSEQTNHLELINNFLNGLQPSKNDMTIIKDPIDDTHYSHTGYIYDGANWIAFDGNYNANNVYFNQDFIFTKPLGVVEIPASGSTSVEAKGKNLQEFFASLFAEEEFPSTPSVSVALNSSNIKAYETGTKIAINYSFAPSAGNYAFGPSTNVSWSNYKATFNNETLTTASGQFKEIQITDDTNLKITGSCSNSDGAIPKTNLGNDYAAAQIKAKNWTGLEKGTLSGYRAWFCGYKNGDNALSNPLDITGAEIRALGNSANGSWKSQLQVDKMQQMYFAAPKGKGYKPVVKDHSTTAPQTVLGPFEVDVPGANNYSPITYEVWYVANASAASGSATLDITKS